MSPDGPFSESPWKIILLSREQQHQSGTTQRHAREQERLHRGLLGRAGFVFSYPFNGFLSLSLSLWCKENR